MTHQDEQPVDPAADSGAPIKDGDELPEAQDESLESTKPSAIETSNTPETAPASGKSNRFKRFWAAYKAKKKLSIPLSVVALIAILLAVPLTRYSILGLFIKEDYKVTVLDSSTGQPISSAQIALAGRHAVTDGSGQAKLHVKVGRAHLSIQKKYYRELNQTVTVALTPADGPLKTKLVATGRQVPLTVINKITGQPLADAQISAAGTEGKTDKNGTVTIVLPADKDKVDATLSADGYNGARATIQITDKSVSQNNFQLTPAGKLYFLSKLSGKIDVVKTNLDGSDRQTVLAGTGNEEEKNTVLLASRDWKYLALQSRRTGDKAKLYLIETASGKLTTLDEGDASFVIAGWLNHYFVYTVYRNNIQNWQPKLSALKSYNAETKQLRVLDETTAEGTGDYDYATERLDTVYVLPDVVVYSKGWQSSYYSQAHLNDKQAKIISVQPDGTREVVLKAVGVPVGTSSSVLTFDAHLYEPRGIYFLSSADNSFYKYDDGQVSATKDVDRDNFYQKSYNTYLLSPNGRNTFWSESRDGKNSLFIGDDDAKNEKQVASLSELTPYGWYTDDYLLASKKGSELYILGKSGLSANQQPLKVTDYHKPNTSFTGYGGGYGGS